MKNALILVAISVLSIFAFRQWQQWSTPDPVVAVKPGPTPALPERHLTPEGTFAILDYVSSRTKTGVVGFEPGQMVRFVSADVGKGTLMVTDGTYNVDVKPEQLTNDLDVASLARRRDQASQQQLHSIVAAAQDEDAKARNAANLDAAKSIGRKPSGATIGMGSTLDKAPSRVGTWHPYYYYRGSPYYYLNR